MAHPRTLVREAVVAALMNATAAGQRVTDTKVEPLKKGEMPAISVYTPSEPVRTDSEDTAPRELTRDVKVEIIGWVVHHASHPVARAMDDLALDIEIVMDANRYLDGAAGESILEDTTMEVLEQDRADPLIGVVMLTYSVTYRTQPSPTALDDFLRAKATHQVVGGVPDTVPAADGPFTVQEIP
jgi:hypothetical protein